MNGLVAPRHLFAVVALLGLTLALYFRCLEGPFVFDDPNAVSQSTLIQSIRPLTRFVQLSTRPLTDFSYAIDYAFGKLDPWWFHVTNVLLHGLNAVLVYLLAWFALGLGRIQPAVMGARSRPRGQAAKSRKEAALSGLEGSDRMLVAWGAAAIFAAHPLATETVAYISSRSEVLVAFFFLLTMIAYTLAVLAPNRTARRVGAAGVPILCAAALGTKEVAVMIPPVLLVYDWSILSRGDWRQTRSRWRLLALALLPLGAGGTFLVARAYLAGNPLGSYGQTAGFGFDRFGRGEYLMTQFGAIAHYLRLVLLPVSLTFDYDWRLARSFWTPGVLLPLALLVALVGLAVKSVRSQPLFSFAILGMLLILAPTSSVVPIADPVVERRMYLPLAGFSLLAAFWIWQLGGRLAGVASTGRRRASAALIAGLLVILGTMTSARAALWGDGVALHRDGVAKAPANPRVRLNLGVTYLNLGRLEEAEAELKEAKRLFDAGESIHAFRRIGAFIHYNLGAVLFSRGDHAGAAQEIEQALRLGGEYLALRSMGMYLLAHIAEGQGDWKLAAARYEEALRHNRSADWYVDLARAQMNGGAHDDAVKSARAALRLSPDHGRASELLAALQKQGRAADVKQNGPLN
jgi:tetratricopeptide (TPR) repeat protein